MKQIVLIIALGLSFTILGQEVNLDSPFPKNQYTHALEAAMQAWSTIELLRDQEASQEDHCFVCDVLIGRLVRLHEAIGQIKKEKVRNMDDLCYLFDLISTIKQEITKLSATRSELKHTAQLWLDKITTQLEKVLQE